MQSMSHQVGEPHLGQNQLETALNFFSQIVIEYFIQTVKNIV
jgi:hypothetical protein